MICYISNGKVMEKGTHAQLIDPEYLKAQGYAGLYYRLAEKQFNLPLKDYLDKGHRFELSQIIKIMLQLLDALDYAHRLGIVHRDIKPANIMIMQRGQIQVADFGIAKIDSSTMTRTGAVLGTPSYMSPEQCLGQPVDPRTDIFSAGVVLYELLTGQKPFTGTTAMTTIHKVLNVTPVNPSKLNGQIPKAFDEIAQKALAKRPDERFHSAKEFAQALQSLDRERQKKKALPKPIVKIILAGTLAVASVAVVRFWWSPGLLDHLLRSFQRTEKPPLEIVKKSPALDRAQLDKLLARFDCASFKTSFDNGNKLILEGHLKPEDLPRLEREIRKVPGINQVSKIKLVPLIWPYCKLVEMLSPFRERNIAEALGLHIASHQHAPHYTQAEHLVLAFTAPRYKAYIYIDYYQLDGGMVHLFPNMSEQNQQVPANARFTLGEPRQGGKRWEVQPPFGTEMIVIMASAEPLFQVLRPEVEPAADYLSVLHQAMAQVDSKQLAADYFYITTEADTAHN